MTAGDGASVRPGGTGRRAAMRLTAAALAVGLWAGPGGCARGPDGQNGQAGSAPPPSSQAAGPGGAPAAGSGPAAQAACRAAQPDLSRLGAQVQARIRRRQAAAAELPPDAAPAAAADTWGALGAILLAASLPAAADPCLRAAAAAAPDDARWPYYLGHLHRDAGRLPEAAAFFDAARQARPDDVATLIRLGEVRLDQGRAADARPLFAQALALRPASLAARFGLARTALLAEDYRRAVGLLEEILARDPTAAAAHHPLGVAWRALGDDARAAPHLRRRGSGAIRPADPLLDALDALIDSARAYETRGNAALDREAWADAAALFRQGLALDPDHPALRHRLGTALYLLGDLDGARAAFERVTRDAPAFPAAHYSLGVLDQAAGRHAAAIARFETALRYHPTDDDARLRLAVSLRRTGDPAAALGHYLRVLRMDPAVVDARFGAAMALVELGRYGDARDRLAAGMDAFPGLPIFPHALARVLAAAPDDAVRDGPRALRLVERLARDDRTIDLGETMAMALAEVGRPDEAAAVQRDLIAAAGAAGLDAATVRRLRAALARYEQGAPSRTPWPPGATP